MTEWSTHEFPDEDLPRSFTHHNGIACVCYPSDRNSGKFEIAVYTSSGNWKKGPYKLIHIRETYMEESFTGFSTLEESQQACVFAVESYLLGEITPTYTERRYDPSKKVKVSESSGTKKRRTKRKKRT